MKNSFFRSLRTLLALAFLTGGLMGCGDSGDDVGVSARLAVEDFEFTRLPDGTRLFTGKVYNPTDEAVREAQISVSLLDENNQQIGTATIRVPDITARDTTGFRQIFDSDQPVRGAQMRRLTVM